MAPVDLPLLTRKGAQAQVGLSARTRSVQADEVAKVIWATAVTTLLHHPVQAAGGEAGELLQRLADEGQVDVNLRGALHRPDPGQTGLRQDAAHRATMHVQLSGDGPDAPLLDVVVAQDMRFELRGNGHGSFLFGQVDRRCEELDGAGGRCEQTRNTDGRKSGRPASIAPLAGPSMMRPPGSSSSRPVDHRRPGRVNPDASRYSVERDNGGTVRHG